jgi:DNA-binding NarL/FixJ family response regulator
MTTLLAYDRLAHLSFKRLCTRAPLTQRGVHIACREHTVPLLHRLDGFRLLVDLLGVVLRLILRALDLGWIARLRLPAVARRLVDLSLQGKGLGGLGSGGLDLIRRLRIDNSRVPILVLSMHSDPVIVSRAMEAGATGYVSKEGPPEDLIEAFEKMRRGETYLSHDLAVEVALLGTRGGATRFAELTPRQLQTLALVAEGKSYEQIAQDLGVSYKTVVNTCSQLKEKLGARKLSDLIRMAIEYLS